jgi:predicted sulfurtransferase
MKKFLAFLLAVLGLNTACSQNFENMEVKEFAELIADSNVVILDVRKADEFAEGHIKGAVLIDQFQSDFVEQAQAKLPKDKIIAIYCRSGRRSANAYRQRGHLSSSQSPIDLRSSSVATRQS